MQSIILLLLALLSSAVTVVECEAIKLKALRAAHTLEIQWGIIGWNEISGAPIAAAGPQGSEPAPIGSCPLLNFQYATTSTHILFNALTLRSVEWVDIHMKTINGDQLNYRMTNEEAKIFTYPIVNDLLSYSFTYASQGMACDTQEFSATASNPTQPTDETTSAPTTTTSPVTSAPTTTTSPVTSAPTTTTVVTDAPPTSAPSTSIQWCRAGTCTSTPPSGVEVGTWVCSSGTCTYQQVTVLGNARCYVTGACQAS